MPGELHRFGTIDELAIAARRAVAADCSLFLRSADPKSERWAPYVRWASKLSGAHTIITFNYDCVPEMLQANLGRLAVITPDRDPESVKRLLEMARSSAAPVLKLHGSTTWIRRGKEVEVAPSWEDGLAPGAVPLLGIPGPGKRAACEQLAVLWEAAEAALAEATQVYFIGYRFPPTDSDSLRRVLGALATGRNDHRSMWTVLGPDLRHPDAVRLLHLVRTPYQGHNAGLADEIPLFAEDFLSLWTD